MVAVVLTLYLQLPPCILVQVRERGYLICKELVLECLNTEIGT